MEDFARNQIVENVKIHITYILIEHSVLTIIAISKLMDVGIDAQKHTSHSWWNFFFTKSSTAQNCFLHYLNPLLVSLITLFLLTLWNCYLTYRIKETSHVT